MTMKDTPAAGAWLERIERLNPKINAFVHFEKENRLRQKSSRPVAIKDNISVAGELTTCASKILKGYKPPYDATVITKLKEKGYALMGKTNMDEFAFGSSCETSFYGPTKNPWDTGRIPGGSSGGSAAAVAAGMVPMALGSDTGGSVRQPAALCGIVGMKPTYGRVSRYGLIAFASSLDQIGTITSEVSLCAELLGAIGGYDELDSTSVDVAMPDYTKFLTKDIKGLRIGIPSEYFPGDGLDSDVRNSLEEAKKIFKGLGASLVEISLPHTKYAVSCYYIIAPAEASSNLARYDGVQYGLREEAGRITDMYFKTRTGGFGEEAKRRILLGTYVLSSGYYQAYYLKAMKVRTKIKNDFSGAFTSCDAILTPTSPTPAFRIGERLDDPLKMYLSDIFTIPANLAGIPGISVPCGFSRDNLPIGLQLLARPFGEETLIRLAYAFEQATEFHKRKPNI